MNSNLLITFTNFSTQRFFETGGGAANSKREDWEIIQAADLVRKGYRGVFRYVRQRKFDRFVVGRDDLTTGEIRYFLEGLLICARAHDKQIIDNAGLVHRVTTAKFLWDSLKFGLEMLFNLMIVGISYVLLGAIRLAAKIPLQRPAESTDSSKKLLAFLRTDYFGAQREGGSFTHAQGFISGARELGWNVIALAHEKFFNDNTTFYKIPYVTFHNSPEIPDLLFNYKFVWHARSILKKERPALLYQRHSFMTVSGLALKILLRTPLVLEYNGSEPWVREKWGGKLFLKHLAYLMESIAIKNADFVAVVSEVLRDELLERGVDAHRIILNPNGVDINKFTAALDGGAVRKTLGLENKKVVGFVGSFGPWHGVEVLARAIKAALQQEPSLHFLIIGDGALRPEVERIIGEENVAHAVTLTGIIPHHQTPTYLAACDILVSPHVPNSDGTKFFGSPTKIFEYMAMGKPIIASNLEQIGQLLQHEETALLVTPGNIKELSQTIADVARNLSERKHLGLRARNTVEQSYTWKHNAERVMQKLYGYKKS